jgi:hypothetical protein
MDFKHFHSLLEEDFRGVDKSSNVVSTLLTSSTSTETPLIHSISLSSFQIVSFIVVSALTSVGGVDELKHYIEQFLVPNIDASDDTESLAIYLECIREIVFQTHIAVGWPKVIDALTQLRASLPRQHAKLLGNALPAWRAATTSKSDNDIAVGTYRAAGDATFAAVYGDKTNVVRAVLRRGSPSLESTILTATYGIVLSDNSLLDLKYRELGLQMFN